MGLSRSVEWLTLPLFVIAQAAPMAAIIPMITYVYGIGLTAKVLAVTVLAVPVIAMNSYKGIRNTSPSLLEMCRSFLGTRAQAVWKIVLPHAGGLIFAGLRLGVAMGFIGVVIAELLITPDRRRRPDHVSPLGGGLSRDVRRDRVDHRPREP